jgi:hypothetical protein
VLAEPFTVLSFTDKSDADVACATTIKGQVTFTKRDTEVRAMRTAFAALTRAALSPADSVERISDLLKRSGA